MVGDSVASYDFLKDKISKQYKNTEMISLNYIIMSIDAP